MSGTIVQFTCPKCGERHVTWECPTCGHLRAQAARPGFYHVTATTQRRDAIAAIMADYAAAHPGVNAAEANVLDVYIWLASRREVLAAE